MYKLQTSQCVGNLEKELAEYHFQLHTARLWMDPYGYIRNALGPEYAHLYHIEDFWENYQDDKEVHVKNYMRMTAYFVKRA